MKSSHRILFTFCAFLCLVGSAAAPAILPASQPGSTASAYHLLHFSSAEIPCARLPLTSHIAYYAGCTSFFSRLAAVPTAAIPSSSILPNAHVGGPEVLEVTLYEGYDGTLIIAWVKKDMGGIGVRYRCSFTPTEFVNTKGAQNSVSPDNWTIFTRMTAVSKPKAHWLLASLADKPEVKLAGGSGSALHHSMEKSVFEDDDDVERGGWTGCLPSLWVPCVP